MLLAESEPSKIRRRLADFYGAVIEAGLPEPPDWPKPIPTWCPAILVALAEDASNAHTESFNRTNQADQAGQLRRPDHDQLPTPHPEPHCGLKSAESSSLNGTKSADIQRAGVTIRRTGMPRLAPAFNRGERNR